MTSAIILTNSSLFALVNDSDYERLNQYKWRLSCGYAVRTVNGKVMHMQWFIVGKYYDHWDCNKLNNQRDNLRIATVSQNGANIIPGLHKTAKSKSIYKGVSWHGASGKWRAVTKIHGKYIHLGLFVNEIDAAKAYNAKALELFGEFARINAL